MRYSVQQKEQTREKILEAAHRTFCRDGYSATGIDAVMAEAGLTAGAFYRHFKSKEELFGEAVMERLKDRRDFLEEGLDGLVGMPWIEGMVHRYLSEQHLDQAECGCPLPALMPELSRACPSIQAGVRKQLLGWAGAIEQAIEQEQIAVRESQRRNGEKRVGKPMSVKTRRQLALSLVSTLVGGMTLARSFQGTRRAESVLRGTRAMALHSVRTACCLTG